MVLDNNTPVFKTGALNRSTIYLKLKFYLRTLLRRRAVFPLECVRCPRTGRPLRSR